MATRDLVAERAEREAVAVDFLSRWDDAAERVLSDPAVWIEEAERTDAAPYAWPPRRPPRGWPQALVLLAESKVIELYMQIAAGPCGDVLLPPMDAADPDFQFLIRVVLRAAGAGERALIEHYGGTRLSLRREYKKIAAELDAERVRRAGGPVRAGFAAAGLPPSTAYRAEARLRSKAKARR